VQASIRDLLQAILSDVSDGNRLVPAAEPAPPAEELNTMIIESNSVTYKLAVRLRQMI
jgi:hypothetical protein